MRNVTPGFKDYRNITVYAVEVVDDVRFMITSDGYDIMYTDADFYLTPADPIGMMMGVEVFEYELTDEDLNARPMTKKERKKMRLYVDRFKSIIEPMCFLASRGL